MACTAPSQSGWSRISYTWVPLRASRGWKSLFFPCPFSSTQVTLKAIPSIGRVNRTTLPSTDKFISVASNWEVQVWIMVHEINKQMIIKRSFIDFMALNKITKRFYESFKNVCCLVYINLNLDKNRYKKSVEPSISKISSTSMKERLIWIILNRVISSIQSYGWLVPSHASRSIATIHSERPAIRTNLYLLWVICL